jgi:hypothetical protein
MDDYLDLAILPDRGMVAYALLAFAFATSLNRILAISLFLAAYALGMIKDLTRTLPLGVRGWQESVFVLLWGSYICTWRCQLSSLAIMGALQLYDDLADYSFDQNYNLPNLVHSWGKTEVLLSLAISFGLAAFLHPQKTLMTFLATPLVLTLVSSLGKGRSHGQD